MAKVIEPSEILMAKGSSHGKNLTANPLVRFLARLVDYSFFCLLLWALKTFASLHFSSDSLQRLIPFEFLGWIPLEALFLRAWGKTPGKWFFNMELRFGGKKRPDWMAAIRRSLAVWFRGLGMGIPFVSFFCLLVAYQRLKMTQKTSWDLDGHIEVIHHPFARWRLAAGAIFSFLSFILYLWG